MKDYCEDQTAYMEESYSDAPFLGCDDGIIFGFESIIVAGALLLATGIGGLYSYVKSMKFRIFINKVFSRKK